MTNPTLWRDWLTRRCNEIENAGFRPPSTELLAVADALALIHGEAAPGGEPADVHDCLCGHTRSAHKAGYGHCSEQGDTYRCECPCFRRTDTVAAVDPLARKRPSVMGCVSASELEPPCGGLTGAEWSRRNPTIIHAAEGVALEPGEYETAAIAETRITRPYLKTGDRFTVESPLGPVHVSGESLYWWPVYKNTRGTRVTAVRRVEPAEAPPKQYSSGSLGTGEGNDPEGAPPSSAKLDDSHCAQPSQPDEASPAEPLYVPKPGERVRVVAVHREDDTPKHTVGQVVLVENRLGDARESTAFPGWLLLNSDTYCRVEPVAPVSERGEQDADSPPWPYLRPDERRARATALDNLVPQLTKERDELRSKLADADKYTLQLLDRVKSRDATISIGNERIRESARVEREALATVARLTTERDRANGEARGARGELKQQVEANEALMVANQSLAAARDHWLAVHKLAHDARAELAKVERERDELRALLVGVHTWLGKRDAHEPEMTAACIIDELASRESITAELRDRLSTLDAELKAGRSKLVQAEQQVRAVINRDKTGLAAGLSHVMAIAKGYQWIPEGHWGSYEADAQGEDVLREECGNLIRGVVDGCMRYLRASGARAEEAARFNLKAPAPEADPAGAERASVADVCRMSLCGGRKTDHVAHGGHIKHAFVSDPPAPPATSGEAAK